MSLLSSKASNKNTGITGDSIYGNIAGTIGLAGQVIKSFDSDDDYTDQDAWAEGLGSVGEMAGIGASIGSFAPGIGTAIGAGVGAIAGGVMGIVNANKGFEAQRRKERQRLINDEASAIGAGSTYAINKSMNQNLDIKRGMNYGIPGFKYGKTGGGFHKRINPLSKQRTSLIDKNKVLSGEEYYANVTPGEVIKRNDGLLQVVPGKPTKKNIDKTLATIGHGDAVYSVSNSMKLSGGLPGDIAKDLAKTQRESIDTYGKSTSKIDRETALLNLKNVNIATEALDAASNIKRELTGNNTTMPKYNKGKAAGDDILSHLDKDRAAGKDITKSNYLYSRIRDEYAANVESPNWKKLLDDTMRAASISYGQHKDGGEYTGYGMSSIHGKTNVDFFRSLNMLAESGYKPGWTPNIDDQRYSPDGYERPGVTREFLAKKHKESLDRAYNTVLSYAGVPVVDNQDGNEPNKAIYKRFKTLLSPSDRVVPSGKNKALNRLKSDDGPYLMHATGVKKDNPIKTALDTSVDVGFGQYNPYNETLLGAYGKHKRPGFSRGKSPAGSNIGYINLADDDSLMTQSQYESSMLNAGGNNGIPGLKGVPSKLGGNNPYYVHGTGFRNLDNLSIPKPDDIYSYYKKNKLGDVSGMPDGLIAQAAAIGSSGKKGVNWKGVVDNINNVADRADDAVYGLRNLALRHRAWRDYVEATPELITPNTYSPETQQYRSSLYDNLRDIKANSEMAKYNARVSGRNTGIAAYLNAANNFMSNSSISKAYSDNIGKMMQVDSVNARERNAARRFNISQMDRARDINMRSKANTVDFKRSAYNNAMRNVSNRNSNSDFNRWIQMERLKLAKERGFYI